MNKLFDKIIDSKLFMKIITFALALLLFSSVYDPDKDSSDVNVPGDNGTDVVENVPVKVYYDTENVVVTGVPKTVDVTLSGPTSHVQVTKKKRDFEVFVNLANAKIGTKEVKLQIKDLSDKLKAKINPTNTEVTVKEKVTKEFKVEAEYSSKSIADGYSAEAASINPGTVKVTGAKDEIDKVAYVKANVEVNGSTSQSIEQQAAISVLDSRLNKLDVQVEPETVNVTIPVKRVSKKVPINIVEKGSPPSNVTIDSITLDTKEASIFGTENVLKNTENVRVEVDLSKIEKDETLSLPIIISDGITSVDPELVNATVKVTLAKENNEESTEETNAEPEPDPEPESESDETSSAEKTSSKTLANVPISIQGLGKNLTGSITSPEKKSTNIEVTAKDSILKGIKASDFSIYVDVTGLEEGEHEVQISVDGPEDTSWELARETASVSISTKGA
ncbi:CdaR family protein [Niallia sp. 01092]|uniref:CdaR family protein n=1 Tax=unclassified Niallia TaxID=2837522 RepID=UPI003FD3CC81